MRTLARREAIDINSLPMHLEMLGLVISGVVAITMPAGVGQELTTVHGIRSQEEGAVIVHGKCSMLPLQDSLGTSGIFRCSADLSTSGNVKRLWTRLTIGDRAIVCLFIVPAGSKRIRNAGQ